MSDERFSFISEWYDEKAALIRKYTFFYYPEDSTIEMYDIKNRRVFLKRCLSTVKLGDLFVGNTVNVFNRQLRFVDYADNFTRSKLSTQKERTLGLVKPDGMDQVGNILAEVQRNGFQITNMCMVQLSRNEAFDLYRDAQSKPFFNDLIGAITSGPVLAFEIMGSDVVNQWRSMARPTVHASDSPVSAEREIEFFFPSGGASRQGTASCNNCTCAVVKPHAVQNGNVGRIISDIMNSRRFKINAMMMCRIEQANAEEFCEVYKGVVSEYKEMVNELMSGPCVAMEIVATDGSEDVVSSFRELVGPADPEICRHLRPHTLRAKYGENKVQNAVHCTDLPEDGVLEVEYFFKILSSKR